jgi:hypothetical protein
MVWESISRSGKFNDAKTLSLVPFVAGSSVFSARRICPQGSTKSYFDSQREALV